MDSRLSTDLIFNDNGWIIKAVTKSAVGYASQLKLMKTPLKIDVSMKPIEHMLTVPLFI